MPKQKVQKQQFDERNSEHMLSAITAIRQKAMQLDLPYMMNHARFYHRNERMK